MLSSSQKGSKNRAFCGFYDKNIIFFEIKNKA